MFLLLNITKNIFKKIFKTTKFSTTKFDCFLSTCIIYQLTYHSNFRDCRNTANKKSIKLN